MEILFLPTSEPQNLVQPFPPENSEICPFYPSRFLRLRASYLSTC